MPKYSIICPVYNTGRYIEKCILSIINQTYDDWELLLIDDGSTDNSHEIISKYLNDKIKYYYQSNSGSGIARNYGITISQGEYICFLDSDDYLDCDYLKLVNEKNHECDAICIDTIIVDENENVIKKQIISKYKKYDLKKFISATISGKLPWGGTRRIVKKSIIVDNHIVFSNSKIGEEALFTFKLLSNCKVVNFVEEKQLYYYVIHKGSQSQSIDWDPWRIATINLKNYIMNNNMIEDYGKALNSLSLTATIISIDRLSQYYKYNKARSYFKLLKTKYKESFFPKKGIDFKNLDNKAKVMWIFIFLNWYSPVYFVSKIKRGLSKIRSKSDEK